MAAKKRRDGVEWVGGVVVLPAAAVGKPEGARAEALVWMSSEGEPIGSISGEATALIGRAGESLRSLIERTGLAGAPKPRKVRVASQSLAEALRAAGVGVEVVCAPTPELDAMSSSVIDRLVATLEVEPTYLWPGLDPAAVAAAFKAFAGLYRARPWEVVPDIDCLMLVNIAQLGMSDLVLCFHGQDDELPGWAIFTDESQFNAYADAIESSFPEDGAPPHVRLQFSDDHELGDVRRGEVARHGWEVVDEEGYPMLVGMRAEMFERPLRPAELTMGEAISLALPIFFEDRASVLEAWNDGSSFARTLVVSTYAGDIEVTLRVPLPSQENAFVPPFDVMARLTELSEDIQELEPHEIDEIGRLDHELMRRFVMSPEGRECVEIVWCHRFLGMALDDLGETLATISPQAVRDLVTARMPREVMERPSQARPLVTTLRAFFAYLKRAWAFEGADACLQVLDEDAIGRCEAAVGEVTAGAKAWPSSPLGHGVGFGARASGSFAGVSAEPRTKPTAAQAKAKKNARKAARKARKKNR